MNDDTGKFHITGRTPKWPPAVNNFSGALVVSGRKFVGDSRERAVTSGHFYRYLFRPSHDTISKALIYLRLLPVLYQFCLSLQENVDTELVGLNVEIGINP